MFHVKHKNEIQKFLTEGLKSLNIDLTESVLDKIVYYFIMLLDKNIHINLISQKQDLKTKVGVHLLDSLSSLMWNELPRQARSLDFGSGGGLPAIPLSIVQTGWNYDLVESTGKKISFLTEVKAELKLENVNLINKYLNPNINDENIFYDLITARAVSSLDKLITIVGPRLNQNGIFIAYKGPQAESELSQAKKELKKWSMDIIKYSEFKLPLIEANRTLLFFKKNN